MPDSKPPSIDAWIETLQTQERDIGTLGNLAERVTPLNGYPVARDVTASVATGARTAGAAGKYQDKEEEGNDASARSFSSHSAFSHE